MAQMVPLPSLLSESSDAAYRFSLLKDETVDWNVDMSVRGGVGNCVVGGGNGGFGLGRTVPSAAFSSMKPLNQVRSSILTVPALSSSIAPR